MIYEYQCMKCKQIIELKQKLDDRIPPMCFEDGCDIEMVPIISKTSFALKGGSWAKDGYK